MPRHDNIFLDDVTTALAYTSPQAGGGAPRVPQRNDALTHSRRLLAELNTALQAFSQFAPQQAPIVTGRSGTFVEFVGAESYDLVTKSLEDARQGIRVMNVREVPVNAVAQVDGQETGTITKATVFIPNGKEQVFINKLTQYATQRTPNGNPKHQPLINSIENICNAINLSRI